MTFDLVLPQCDISTFTVLSMPRTVNERKWLPISVLLLKLPAPKELLFPPTTPNLTLQRPPSAAVLTIDEANRVFPHKMQLLSE